MYITGQSIISCSSHLPPFILVGGSLGSYSPLHCYFVCSLIFIFPRMSPDPEILGKLRVVSNVPWLEQKRPQSWVFDNQHRYVLLMSHMIHNYRSRNSFFCQKSWLSGSSREWRVPLPTHGVRSSCPNMICLLRMHSVLAVIIVRGQ